MDIFWTKYKEYKLLIDNRLKELLEITIDNKSEVARAMDYSLNIGGKRIRPILVLAFCKMCGGLECDALDIACAIEMVHTYSLIHDDLPCMDDDDLRRGKPSCHIKFGQSIALLAGDGLLTYAFNIIADTKLKSDVKIKIIKAISEAIGHKGMLLGQEMDIKPEKNFDLKTISKINILKTSELIKTSAVIGCIIARGNKEQIEVAGKYGQNIGLAFQIKDDVIDVVGDENIIGKPVMSDRNNNKLTYVDLIGIEDCEKEIKKLSTKSTKILYGVFDYEVDFLVQLTSFLLNRKI